MIEVDRHFGIVRGAFGRAARRTRVTASRRHPRTLRSTPVPVRFTPEFALSLPLVSDAQISPDGETIAFVVADQSRPSGPNRPALVPSAIHLVPAGGDDPHRLTFGRADTTPRWSANGASLAFLSDRQKDGQRQVFVLPLDGGEARQLTHLDSEIPVARSFNP